MVTDKVKAMISDHLGLKLEDIKDESSFVEDLGMDSLDQVELVLAMEEQFGIEIPDKDAEELETVKRLVEYIESKVNKS